MKIDIQSFAEREHDLLERRKWGDFWVQKHLEIEFELLGCEVGPGDCLLYLYGLPMPVRPARRKIAWVYSHPDRCDFDFLKQFDKVYCLSDFFAPELEKHGIHAEIMLGATNRAPVSVPIQHDIVFVGNSRANVGRAIINDLYAGHLENPLPYSVEIWGWGWDKHPWYAGPYYPNEELGRLYASSAISLNDHHTDMSRWGFVAVKLFDILASGGFALSDTNRGIFPLFGERVPQYKSKRELRALVDHYMGHPETRAKTVAGGVQIATTCSWKLRAETLMRAFEELA